MKNIKFLIAISFVFSILALSDNNIYAYSEKSTNYTHTDEELMQIIEIYHQSPYSSPDYLQSNKSNATLDDLNEVKRLINDMDSSKISTRAWEPDPNYTKFIQSSGWIIRSGEVSLSIDIKDSALYTNLPNATAANAYKAFDALITQHGSHSYWRNTASMEAQFHCHVNWARYKQPWNIEPHRTETNWTTTIAKGCNP